MDFLNAVVAITNLLIIPAAFGTVVTIGITTLFQSWGISLGPLPTALLALPFAVAITAVLLVGTDFAIYRFYRKKRAVPIIFVMASLGVMFVMNGLIRFMAGVKDQTFDDGTRFIIKARDFKNWSGLDEALALRTTQVLTLVVAIAIVAWLFWFLNKTRTG
ncbi:MAG: branched-chain amino acid ABC transporter permease, partial [Marivivens sp.]|nr:branched-chain amino acid ABC transporter permease [Marivivens sp.]